MCLNNHCRKWWLLAGGKIILFSAKSNDEVYDFCLLMVGEQCMQTIKTQDINQLGVNLEASDFYTNECLQMAIVSSGCCS